MRFILHLALGFSAKFAFASCDTNYLWCRLENMNGVTCNSTTGGKVCVLPANTPGFSYSKPMAVLIPTNLKTPKQMVLGMHGNRGYCPTVGAAALDVALSWGATKELPSDAVMFFPMSTGVTVEYQSELAPKFQKFAKWAQDLTGAPSNADWTIAGHSGSGRAIAMILGEKPSNVKAALMLDAAYNCTWANYAWRWRAAKDGRAKIYNVFTTGAGTLKNSRWLANELGPSKFDSRLSTADYHCAVPRAEFGPLLREALGEKADRASPQDAPPPAENDSGVPQLDPNNPFLFSPGTN
jgi:hypothetical protein